MFKKGFTLAEMLISLAIIGVIAALTMPGLLNSKPKKEKAMYMKAYNTLTTQTADILGNPELYYTTYDANGNPNCRGLSCTGLPVDSNYSDNKYSGTTKFAYLFADRLNLTVAPTYYNGNGYLRCNSTDGAIWEIGAPNCNSSDCKIDVYITSKLKTVPGPQGSQKIFDYGEAFHFIIDTDGGVTPEDAKGKEYLKDATSITN